MLLQRDKTSKASNGKVSQPHPLLILTLCLTLFLFVGVPSDTILKTASNLPTVRFTPFSVYPVVSPRKSSDFGWRVHPIRGFSSKHLGVDLAAPIGTPIRTVADGRVVFADPYAGYGNLVVIQHVGGMTTHYAHCSSLGVTVGDSVQAGQIIAQIGSTGASTGPHLHFEVRVDGVAQNPELFMPYLAAQAQG